MQTDCYADRNYLLRNIKTKRATAAMTIRRTIDTIIAISSETSN